MAEFGYKVWAADDVFYGPVDKGELVDWIREGRVVSDTWVFSLRDQAFSQAGESNDFAPVFRELERQQTEGKKPNLTAMLSMAMLRRIRVLTDLEDDDLTEFANHMELARFGNGDVVLAQGAQNDAMHLIVEGEVRVCQREGDAETELATLEAGEFFGDISLFDAEPCSADVITSMPSIFMKITQLSLIDLKKDRPAAVAGFLRNLANAMVRRIRLDNRRLQETLRMTRKQLEEGRESAVHEGSDQPLDQGFAILEVSDAAGLVQQTKAIAIGLPVRNAVVDPVLGQLAPSFCHHGFTTSVHFIFPAKDLGTSELIAQSGNELGSGDQFGQEPAGAGGYLSGSHLLLMAVVIGLPNPAKGKITDRARMKHRVGTPGRLCLELFVQIPRRQKRHH